MVLLANLWLVGCSSPISDFLSEEHEKPVNVQSFHQSETPLFPIDGEEPSQPERIQLDQQTNRQKDLHAFMSSFPCDRAEAGSPIDVSVPDDSLFSPGERFIKIWRLRNSGSCPWTQDYAVVWFSGAPLGVKVREELNTNVHPGEEVEIAVEMVAPAFPGIYQSNWKMQNSRGDFFGIGPEGHSPFWVKIQVLPQVTPTVEPMFTPSPSVPEIHSSGNFVLYTGDFLNLDNGMQSVEEDIDFSLESTEDGFWIRPLNGSQLTIYGFIAPSYQECLLSNLTQDPVFMGKELHGSFLCVKTDEGRTGSMFVLLDFERRELSGTYILWE